MAGQERARTIPTPQRWGRFAVVGAAGFVVQLETLWCLTSYARWHWLTATLSAVEVAIIHNFLWHARWTWRDRSGERAQCFARFQLANGIASLAGNVVVMAVFSGPLGGAPPPANVCAVALTAAANFFAADRWVFRRARQLRVGAALFVAFASAPATAAAQTAETIAAWNRCVAATEARLERTRVSPRLAAGEHEPTGDSVRVPSGTISDWRGSVFIRDVTLDRLLHRLQHPGTPPPQEDVVSSRVIERGENSLRVGIRLVRRAIVTVTYETEHDMRFRRWTPRLATARSVATRIEEVGGSTPGSPGRQRAVWGHAEDEVGVQGEREPHGAGRGDPAN